MLWIRAALGIPIGAPTNPAQQGSVVLHVRCASCIVPLHEAGTSRHPLQDRSLGGRGGGGVGRADHIGKPASMAETSGNILEMLCLNTVSTLRAEQL